MSNPKTRQQKRKQRERKKKGNELNQLHREAKTSTALQRDLQVIGTTDSSILGFLQGVMLFPATTRQMLIDITNRIANARETSSSVQQDEQNKASDETNKILDDFVSRFKDLKDKVQGELDEVYTPHGRYDPVEFLMGVIRRRRQGIRPAVNEMEVLHCLCFWVVQVLKEDGDSLSNDVDLSSAGLRETRRQDVEVATRALLKGELGSMEPTLRGNLVLRYIQDIIAHKLDGKYEHAAPIGEIKMALLMSIEENLKQIDSAPREPDAYVMAKTMTQYFIAHWVANAHLLAGYSCSPTCSKLETETRSLLGERLMAQSSPTSGSILMALQHKWMDVLAIFDDKGSARADFLDWLGIGLQFCLCHAATAIRMSDLKVIERGLSQFRAADRAVGSREEAVEILELLVEDYQEGHAWVDRVWRDNMDGIASPRGQWYRDLLIEMGCEPTPGSMMVTPELRMKIADDECRRSHMKRMARDTMQQLILLTWNQKDRMVEVEDLVGRFSFHGSDEFLTDLVDFVAKVEQEGVHPVVLSEKFSMWRARLKSLYNILAADGGPASLIVPMTCNMDDLLDLGPHKRGRLLTDELQVSTDEKDSLCSQATSAYLCAEYVFAAFETYAPNPRFKEKPTDYSPSLICYAIAIESELIERVYAPFIDELAQDTDQWPDEKLRKLAKTKEDERLAKAILQKRKPNGKQAQNPPLGNIAFYFKKGAELIRSGTPPEQRLVSSWILYVSRFRGYERLLSPSFISCLDEFKTYRNDAAHTRSVDRHQFLVGRRVAQEMLDLLVECRNSERRVDEEWFDQSA